MADTNLTTQLRRGIKHGCINRDTTIRDASMQAKVDPSTIYRFVKGDSDIKLVTLDRFCRKGLGYTLQEVATLGT